MKKILIISYFYPPANFVGAQRTAAWAKYLHEYGYYPIIVTRQWNKGQTDLVDRVINNVLSVEKRKTHEVHRLPYSHSLRDRLSNYPLLKPIQKALTLKELVFSNYRLKSLPFANFYAYSKTLLKNDSKIKIVLASGRPFQSFFIGYQLKNDFPDIHWIPDYRDEWSTHQTPNSLSYTHKVMKLSDKKSELKWTSNASFFISVTPNWTKHISNFINIEGKTILNGFEIDSPPYLTSKARCINELELSYLGSAYSSQDFSVIIDSVSKVSNKLGIKIIVNFIGSRLIAPKKVSKQHQEGNGSFEVRFFERMDRKDLIQKVKETDVLFLTSLKNNDGWLPVKIFDYFNSDKPILLCPSDHDLMEKFILETHSGYIANTTPECSAILEKLIHLKKEGEPLIGPRNQENAYFYSRKYQTKVLARYLDELI